jgi:methylenetetrahydrofolate reductase (NADPH)
MKVIEHLRKADRTLLSFEILPPLKGKDIHSIYEASIRCWSSSPASSM